MISEDSIVKDRQSQKQRAHQVIIDFIISRAEIMIMQR